jgi:hypothetical protein
MLVIMLFGQSPTRNEQALTSFLSDTPKTPTSFPTSTSFTDPLIRSISSSRSYRTPVPRPASLPISLINTCSTSGTSSSGAYR